MNKKWVSKDELLCIILLIQAFIAISNMSAFRGLSWKNKHRENILKVLIVALRVLYSFYTLISNELFSRHLVKQYWWLKLTALKQLFILDYFLGTLCALEIFYSCHYVFIMWSTFLVTKNFWTNKFVLPCFGEWVPNCGPAPHKGSGWTRGIYNCSQTVHTLFAP